MTKRDRHTRHQHDDEHEDGESRRNKRRDARRLRRALGDLGDDVKDIATDALDVAEDVIEVACAAADTVEDCVEDTLRPGNHEGQEGGDGGRRGRGGAPWRPTRKPGTSRGDIPGGALTKKHLHAHPPPTSWAGPRKMLPLPMLFLRANPGDTGTRPVAGVFWESPDVYVLGGVAPAAAPAAPAQLGQSAQASADNTVYAHVWNLGRGQARDVVVEFYWCNPTLGFNPIGTHLIGTAGTALGARGSGDCHRVVKCPQSWLATYENGGHECILVRAFDVTADPLSTPDWDASINRHLGQRNIHVVPAGQTLDQPMTFGVGELFGHGAQVQVARHGPATMPWLQLHSGVRGQFPNQALATGDLSLGQPGQLGSAGQLDVHGDGAQVVFATGDGPPGAGQAHVYRVTAAQQGQVFGGYTVVLVG
jgi:hypothetical protein